MTPAYAWKNIEEYIPKDKKIWEAFYGDGKSGTYLEEMGYNVIHEPVDFFKNDMGDIIVSNPPFSKSKEVMKRLLVLDKPFIILFPSSKINTQYFREWRNKNLQIIIPRARIHFDKKVEGETPEDYKSSCNFDCFYYCYKMNLPSDIVWLEEDKRPKVVVKKYKCKCGSEIKESNKEKHFETKKHKKFIEKKKKTITITPKKKKLIIKPKEETITIEPTNFKYPNRCSKIWNVEKQKDEWKQYLGAGQYCSPEIIEEEETITIEPKFIEWTTDRFSDRDDCYFCKTKNDNDWNDVEDAVCIECSEIWEYNENDDGYYNKLASKK
tara:strand:- start:187 stop:1158 length:972 start_codon:yes stop_codon:yes gene_type:complete